MVLACRITYVGKDRKQSRDLVIWRKSLLLSVVGMIQWWSNTVIHSSSLSELIRVQLFHVRSPSASILIYMRYSIDDKEVVAYKLGCNVCYFPFFSYHGKFHVKQSDNKPFILHKLNPIRRGRVNCTLPWRQSGTQNCPVRPNMAASCRRPTHPDRTCPRPADPRSEMTSSVHSDGQSSPTVGQKLLCFPPRD